MTKITYVVPEFHNIGDKVVWLGAKSHYEAVYPRAEHELLFMSRPPTDTFSTDVLAVVGTPWLWNLCCLSEKYDTLRRIVSLCKCHRREALGIGANYRLDWIGRPYLKYQHPDEFKSLHAIWSAFDSVVVRDPIAKEVLDMAGVRCRHERCPSHRTASYLGVKPGPRGPNLLVYYDLMAGIGSEVMSDREAAGWQNLVRAAVERYSIKEAICIRPDEVESAAALGIKAELYAEPFPDSGGEEAVRRLLQRLAAAGDVVSGRVHVGIPAATLGRRVVMLPVDSRHLTADAPTYYDENPLEARWYE